MGLLDLLSGKTHARKKAIEEALEEALALDWYQTDLGEPPYNKRKDAIHRIEANGRAKNFPAAEKREKLGAVLAEFDLIEIREKIPGFNSWFPKGEFYEQIIKAHDRPRDRARDTALSDQLANKLDWQVSASGKPAIDFAHFKMQEVKNKLFWLAEPVYSESLGGMKFYAKDLLKDAIKKTPKYRARQKIAFESALDDAARLDWKPEGKDFVLTIRDGEGYADPIRVLRENQGVMDSPLGSYLTISKPVIDGGDTTITAAGQLKKKVEEALADKKKMIDEISRAIKGTKHAFLAQFNDRSYALVLPVLSSDDKSSHMMRAFNLRDAIEPIDPRVRTIHLDKHDGDDTAPAGSVIPVTTQLGDALKEQGMKADNLFGYDIAPILQVKPVNLDADGEPTRGAIMLKKTDELLGAMTTFSTNRQKESKKPNPPPMPPFSRRC